MNPSYLLVILGVVMVSYSGPLVKGALLAGATPVTVACLRMLLSVPPLFLIACLPRKNGSRPISGLRGLTLRQWRWNLLGSVCLALHYLTWMSSLNATSTFASVALVCTQPLFVAIFSAVLLKERMPKRCRPGALIALMGTVMIGMSGLSGAASELRGDLLALAGALCLAAHWMCSRYGRRTLDAFVWSLLTYVQTGLILLIASPLVGGLRLPAGAVWYILGLVAGCTLLGHFLFTVALGKVSATVVSFALLGEPVGAMLWSMLLFGEQPTPILLAGGAVVLLGLALYTAEEIRGAKL